mmetsp:Transcript_28317/g.91320  ORF Transcript_28317/g.91320 Transcript_28317/m.91320 type:complete len:358 (+) Transcript_28317:274-1347(+)
MEGQDERRDDLLGGRDGSGGPVVFEWGGGRRELRLGERRRVGVEPEGELLRRGAEGCDWSQVYAGGVQEEAVEMFGRALFERRPRGCGGEREGMRLPGVRLRDREARRLQGAGPEGPRTGADVQAVCSLGGGGRFSAPGRGEGFRAPLRELGRPRPRRSLSPRRRFGLPRAVRRRRSAAAGKSRRPRLHGPRGRRRRSRSARPLPGPRRRQARADMGPRRRPRRRRPQSSHRPTHRRVPRDKRSRRGHPLRPRTRGTQVRPRGRQASRRLGPAQVTRRPPRRPRPPLRPQLRRQDRPDPLPPPNKTRLRPPLQRTRRPQARRTQRRKPPPRLRLSRRQSPPPPQRLPKHQSTHTSGD